MNKGLESLPLLLLPQQLANRVQMLASNVANDEDTTFVGMGACTFRPMRLQKDDIGFIVICSCPYCRHVFCCQQATQRGEQ